LLAFWQVLVVACHWPPAFSQSVFVLYCDKSVDVPLLVGGLAEGDVVDGPLDEPELGVPGLLELPLGLLLS
jgi:hypothetical protein